MGTSIIAAQPMPMPVPVPMPTMKCPNAKMPPRSWPSLPFPANGPASGPDYLTYRLQPMDQDRQVDNSEERAHRTCLISSLGGARDGACQIQPTGRPTVGPGHAPNKSGERRRHVALAPSRLRARTEKRESEAQLPHRFRTARR